MNPQRPKWSLKTNFWAAVWIAAIASACVFLIVKKSVWAELEIIVGVLSVISLAYFFFLLYHGIRFEKNETYSITWKPFEIGSWSDYLGIGDTGGIFAALGAEAGPLGCLAGLILDIFVSIFLVIIVAYLLWLGANVVTIGILVILFPLYYLFTRSLRYVVTKGRACHGNVAKSLQFAVTATVLNMIWLYLIIFAGHHISKWFGK